MKNNYFNLTTDEQKIVLEQTSIRKSLPKQAIEKDLWVTEILQIMFGLPCAGSLVFKGGTSLSKVWNLISRFSEDIDLAIDRALFGLDGDLTKKGVKNSARLLQFLSRKHSASNFRPPSAKHH